MIFWKEYKAKGGDESANESFNGRARGLFVTDLDGTLLTDERTVRSQELACLQQLRRKGVRVAVATGRSHYSIQRFVEGDTTLNHRFRECIDYVIFSTGAGVFDVVNRRLLAAYSLEVEDVATIANYLDQLEVDYMIHAPIPETRRFYYRSVNGGGEDFLRRVEMYRDHGEPLHTVTKERLKVFGGATEVLCIESGDRGLELANRISRELKGYSVIRATSPLDHRSMWIEIFHANSSKSAAVKLLAARLGVGRKKVCAVGNDYNDADMLYWAGEGYLVENGPLELRDRCYVVASNNEGGVSEAADTWLSRLAGKDSAQGDTG